MPRRRLPRTNDERNAALTRAKERKDDTLDPTLIPYTPATIAKLDIAQPQYVLKLGKVAGALSQQADSTAKVTEWRTLASYFIADMLEAMQRAVRRKTFVPSDRAYYQLPVGESLTPRLRTDAEVLEWGQKTLQGEADRVAAGGAPITFPDATEVQTAFNDFKQGNLQQAALKAVYDTAQQVVQEANPDVDKLILKLWNETETFFDEGDKASMRRKAREWGVVYVPSTGETPLPEDYSLLGKTRLEDGTPLPNVKVIVMELGIDVITDTDGTFYFGVLLPGTYTVVASLEGYLDVTLPGTIITEGAITELDIIMKPTPPDPEP